MTKPYKIAVTGAGGQIGYALVFRLAAGELFGKDHPVVLHLIEVPQALPHLAGLKMELEDCAFPTLHDVICTDDPYKGFGDVDCAFLIGARPRTADMERSDLLNANAQIFSVQGKALNESASSQVRVLVVGNPANTNALITRHSAPNLDANCFAAMTRLDHNRTIAQLALQTKTHPGDIYQVIIWGNHSATQYPDVHHTLINNTKALDLVNEKWYHDEMIATVQQRGTAIIKARGASSAASAANAALDTMRDWLNTTRQNDWTSTSIYSQGQYGIHKDIFYSFPVVCSKGECTVVEGLAINDFSHKMMKATEKELLEERDAVKDLLN